MISLTCRTHEIEPLFTRIIELTILVTFNNLVFFQNEEIFVQLDELDELDRITHAGIGIN